MSGYSIDGNNRCWFIITTCPNGCISCTSNYCISCYSNFFLRNDSLCYTTCLDPFYADNTTLTCKNCTFNCSSCVNTTYCNSCSPGYFLRDDHTCQSDCVPRTYADKTTLTCKSCPYDCYTCNSNGTCISCNSTVDHRQLNQTTLRCDPQDGYYDSQNQTTVSLKCLPWCPTCQSISICTSCKAGFKLEANLTCTNLLNCSSRSILNSLTQFCQKCPYDCYSCFNNNTCQSCSIDDNRQFDFATGRCIPLSQYFDNQTTVCVPCPSNCLICKSLTLCTVCLNGTYMGTNQLCYAVCPIRQFANSQTKLCQACPYDCVTCNTQAYCLSCNSSDNRMLDPITRRCIAAPKFF